MTCNINIIGKSWGVCSLIPGGRCWG